MIELKYRVSEQELINYIRTLIHAGGEKEHIAIRSINMHIAKQYILISALLELGIVETKIATRAYTRKETDFTYLLNGSYISHVKLRSDYREKAREAKL